MSELVLTKELLTKYAFQLANTNTEFRHILSNFGVPPLWDRPMGFPTLVSIILEQQVSLASAKKVYEKLNRALDKLTPELFLTLNDYQLKRIGFSHQKTRYCREVASKILNGYLNLNTLNYLNDQAVKKILTSITGIGHWTSDIYLLMVLLRADVWPHGDRALAVAAYEVFNLSTIPSYEFLKDMAEAWKPFRAIAARFLWHYYLNTKRKKIH